MNIAIIPARKKSQRIKNKNIKLFMGKPLIFWSINTAKKSKIFDRIIVSTDDKKISKLSKKYGADVPFVRPKKLSDSTTGIIDVIQHAIKKLDSKKIKYKNICCILATAPLLTAETIKKGLLKLKQKKLNFVFGATKINNACFRSFYFKNNKLHMLNENFYKTNSQDLPDAYSDAGQFFWGTKSAWVNNKRIFSNKSGIIKLNKNQACDINSPKDFKLALKLAKKMKK